MKRLLLALVFVVYVAAATRCIVKDDKDEPEVHVIRLGDRSGGSDESDVIALQIPENRRRRETHETCKKDKDCAKGKVCVPYLGCVRGHRKATLDEMLAQQ